MTAREPTRRAFSTSTLGMLATIALLYAFGMRLLDPAVATRLTFDGPIVCGHPALTFATPGRMRWPHGREPQPATGRLLVVDHERFPYSVSQRPPYERDLYPVSALGLRPDDPGWRWIPRIDGHPLRVRRTLLLDDKLLFSGSVQPSPRTKPTDLLVVRDAEGRIRVARDRQRLRAIAIETSTRSLVSIEERETIYGGQPKEEERPPQSLVFEPLDADGMPQPAGSHRHPIRRLQNLLSDDAGHVYLIRWQPGPTRIAQSQYGNRMLDKYSIRERRILWSIQLDDDPVQEHHLRPSRLVLAEAGIRFEQDHLVPRNDTGREHDLLWRARTYDQTSGAFLGQQIGARPGLNPDTRAELEIAGQRYALRERGWRPGCLAIVPLPPPR